MTQNPDDSPLAHAGADLREASEAAAKVDKILEQVDRELEEFEGGGSG